MIELITLIVFAVTIIPMIIIALILAPFGLADDWTHGYENWLTDTVCNCRVEEQNRDSHK